MRSNTFFLRGITFSLALALTACGGTGLSSSQTTNSAPSGAGTGTTGTATGAPTSSTILALSASTYSASAAAGSATLTINRSGSSSGTASVSYSTANGTASAGTDYTATSGSLQWASGDSSAKRISIPITGSAGGKKFSVNLTTASGAALGNPRTATIAVAAAGSTSGGTISLGTSTYSTSPGSVTIQVGRAGSTSGAASVAYSTANGSAVAGTDYTATSGTLQWQAGDGASKSFSIPIASGNGGRSFTVNLAKVTGAALGTPSVATVTILAPSSGSASLSIRVQGDHFIDANGQPLQLRGVNVSGLEFTAVQGWSPTDPWGGMSPNWNAIKAWDANVVRLPLNEASWLGYTCVDGTGATRNPDPGHNYQSTVKKAVADATAAGLYVIVDLHWTAPSNFCPLAQNPMADADNSINFWTSVANSFKGYPNVVFELFNEPYLFYLTSGETEWGVLMQGGTMNQYVTGDGSAWTKNYTWKVAGMQQMLDTIRATGATNVVLAGGVSWSQDLSQWAANKPKDPLNQLAAVWHAYPNSGTVGDAQAALPKFGSIGYTWTDSVLSAGYPVLITEFGDHDAPGTVGAPFVSKLLPWADSRGVSYLGWTWDSWGDSNNVLIKDSSGTPTDGYGVYTKAHYLCVGGGSSVCP